MLRALLRAGVIQDKGKIPLGRAPQALLDGLPGREQVREGDHAEIVHERRPQHRRTGERRRHAGDHLDLHRFDPLRQLEQRPGHAIDPRVPAA